jgi:ribosomal-protein-alanine N-acetyltransferase
MNRLPWRLRPGAPADLAAVVAIERASFVDPWPVRSLLTELQPDRLRCPLVAEVAGEMAGYLLAWRVANQLHILNLAVRPDLRRTGIATALLRASLEEAQARGLTEATLEVRPSNQGALAFYQRHGFVPAGRRRRYYANTGEDALIMTVPLPPPAPLAGPAAD